LYNPYEYNSILWISKMNTHITKPEKYFLILFSIFSFLGNTYAADINCEHAYAQSAVTSIAFLNQGADIASDKGVMTAVSSVSPNSIKSAALFGAISAGKSKYKTDSKENCINIVETSLLVGLAKSFNIGLENLNLAPFFELGVAKGLGELDLGPFFVFKLSASDESNDLPVVELGNPDYTGGGLLGHIDFKNFYGEFSARLGFNKANFSIKVNDVTTDYDYSASYGGYHIGAGHISKISSILKLDTYGKYFFTRKFSKDVKLSDGKLFRVANANSQRARIGSILSFIFSEHASAYCGTAWEYELLGAIDIKESVRTFPNLKGGSFIGEVGAADSFKDFYFDISVQFFAGERNGTSVMLRVSFDLFSRINRFLGYSVEKFYLDKTKRFSKKFEMSKKDCFDKTLEIIKKLRARVTHKNFEKGYIIAFDFAKSFEACCLDSTEAGVFITETNPNNVTVEVCSNNSVLGERFSIKFFEMLISDDLSKNQDDKK
jgi:hypothetical protein